MSEGVFLFEEPADFISCVNAIRSYMGDVPRPAAALSKKEWIENMLVDNIEEDTILKEVGCSRSYLGRVKRGLYGR